MRAIVTALCLVVAAFTLVGCSTMRRVDAATFIQYGERTREMNSAKDYDLAGVKDGKAMIRYWTAIVFGGSKTVIYWVPLSELPPAVAAELSAGKNPWGPTWKDGIRAQTPAAATKP